MKHEEIFWRCTRKKIKADFVTADEGIEEGEGGQNWKHQKCKSVKKSGII